MAKPLGSVNFETRDIITMLKADAKAHNQDWFHPLIYLQRIAMGEAEPDSTTSERIDCAKTVLQYILPKRRPVDELGRSGEPVVISLQHESDGRL